MKKILLALFFIVTITLCLSSCYSMVAYDYQTDREFTNKNLIIVDTYTYDKNDNAVLKNKRVSAVDENNKVLISKYINADSNGNLRPYFYCTLKLDYDTNGNIIQKKILYYNDGVFSASDSNQMIYRYDNNGNMTLEESLSYKPDGAMYTNYVYTWKYKDVLIEKTKTEYRPDGTKKSYEIYTYSPKTNTSEKQEYTYDETELEAKGNLTKAAYDSEGREILAQIYEFLPDETKYICNEVKTAYDSFGNITLVENNAYSSSDVQDWQRSYKLEIKYDTHNNITLDKKTTYILRNQEIIEKNIVYENTYDSDGHLTNVKKFNCVDSQKEIVEALDYTYDASENVASKKITNYVNGLASEIYDYEYDSNDRVTLFKRSYYEEGVLYVDNSHEYSYDANSNETLDKYTKYNKKSTEIDYLSSYQLEKSYDENNNLTSEYKKYFDKDGNITSKSFKLSYTYTEVKA